MILKKLLNKFKFTPSLFDIFPSQDYCDLVKKEEGIDMVWPSRYDWKNFGNFDIENYKK